MKKPYRLPNVVDMEKAVLAAMILKDGIAIPTVTSILQAEDFYREEHRIIFRAILRLWSKKISPNILSLIEEMRETDELEKVGATVVTSLADANYTTAYAEVYSLKIKEKSTLRKLIEAGEYISAEAYTDQKPLPEILEEAEKKIFAITFQNETSEFEPITPIIDRAFEKFQYAMNHPGEFTGVKSNFSSLDRVTSGFQKSDLILIAARPSMGKTAFALNLALNAAFNKFTVAIFSLEMSKEQLGSRLLSIYSRTDSLKISTGQVSTDELNDVIHAVEKVGGMPIYIDDTAGISIPEMRSKSRRLKTEHGLDLIVVDYLQLMQGSAARVAESRQQEISEISRNLKSLARELKVPVIALSQLSRNVELRAEKKPQLSDLRESGSLEQDADIVMFLYREEYYNVETENQNIAEIIIAKNRNGPTTNIRLQFAKECMRFSELAYEAD